MMVVVRDRHTEESTAVKLYDGHRPRPPYSLHKTPFSAVAPLVWLCSCWAQSTDRFRLAGRLRCPLSFVGVSFACVCVLRADGTWHADGAR
eukprot:2183703-Prymnesium_polylepis.2